MTTSTPSPAAAPPQPEPRRTRRRHPWRRVLVAVLVVTAVLALLVYGAGGWYFAGRIESGGLQPSPMSETADYDLVVTATTPTTVTLAATGDVPTALTAPSSYVLRWPGGSGHVSPATGSDPLTRPLGDITGTPVRTGDPATLERDWYLGDPKTALGLAYQQVDVAGPLGALPAWYVPAATPSTTTVVMVHGKGGLRREFLRMLPTVHAAGMNALIATYRNDSGVAADPSGHYTFGASDWADVGAAVEWATGHGATDVVLYGISMGGALVASYLQHVSPNPARAVVLDAPMLDFAASVEAKAARDTLPVVGLPIPGALTWAAEQISSLRYGIDWGAVDYATAPTWLTVPALVLHGSEDPTNPVGVSERLAAASPDLVDLEVFPGAAHVESWNTDRQRYESTLARFLASVPTTA